MIDWRAIGMAFQKMVQVVCFCAIPPLLWVLFIAWLHERDIHPFRKACRVFRRPLLELMIILSLVGAAIHTGAVKSNEELRMKNEELRGVTGAEQLRLPMLPSVSDLDPNIFHSSFFTLHSPTSLCFTGILPTTNSVFLGIGVPTNDVPPFVDIYAKHDLVTNGWSAVAAAEFPAGENQFTVELPYSLLPGGWGSSMFFMLGSSIDTDGDGLTDAFELLVSGTYPAIADTDGDGLSDGFEWMSDSGVSPFSPDTDGDGIGDLEEYLAGSNPASAHSDGDALSDMEEIGAFSVLDADEFLWLDVSSGSDLLAGLSSRDSGNWKIPLANGIVINGVQHTNAAVCVDGLVHLLNPTNTSGWFESTCFSLGGLSNVQMSASHVAVAGLNANLYVKPPEWGSEIRHGTVVTNGHAYGVVEYRNIGLYDFRDEAGSLMSCQLIFPADETNTIYVSYLEADDAFATNRYALAGIQCPAMRSPLDTNAYYNLTFPLSAGRFSHPFTLKYVIGTGTSPIRTDTDGDGISDSEEFLVHHTNPLDADTDGDGLDDGLEMSLGTDPLSGDTDGDGMPDGWEAYGALNPLVNDAALDADIDGISNLDEYEIGTNPGVPDTDGDGLSDRDEIGWWEYVESLPAFDISCGTNLLSSTQNYDSQCFVLPLPFVFRCAGYVHTNMTVGVNGMVGLMSDRETSYFSASDSNADLEGYTVSSKHTAIAAYWDDLYAPQQSDAQIIVADVMAEGRRYAVIEYSHIRLYSQKNVPTCTATFQIVIPESETNTVYVNYLDMAAAFDGSGATLGAQLPRREKAFQPSFNVSGSVTNGMAVAYHFGTGSDPLMRDTDGDGLRDDEEADIGTSPRYADTDLDGLSDLWENVNDIDPLSPEGDDGAEGDPDGDFLKNAKEYEYGTNPTLPDTDGDGLEDGMETGSVFATNAVPWLLFDTCEDLTTDVSTNNRRCATRQLPVPLLIQGELVTNLTVSANGIVFLNRADYQNPGRTTSGSDFRYPIDENTLAIAPYLDYLYVRSNIPGRETAIRFGTATHGGDGYLLVEYENAYLDTATYRTNAVSFQLAISTNTPCRAYAMYRDLSQQCIEGFASDIGMQTFGGRWVHSYCRNTSGKVWNGLCLAFLFGENSDPLAADTDDDGLSDGQEFSLGTSPAKADTDGDELPDAWEAQHGLDPLSPDGGDGASGDPDGDGVDNFAEYELGTNPHLADTDGDGLADGREAVCASFANPLPWLDITVLTNLTDAITNSLSESADWDLPTPVFVQGETVTNITISRRGIICLNREGYDHPESSHYVDDLSTCVVDANAFVVVPYGRYLDMYETDAPSSITVGTAEYEGMGYVVIEYANMYRGNPAYETNAISSQVAIPTGRVDRICVSYAGVRGYLMDGRDAVIGCQSFGAASRVSYCYYEQDKIYDGMGIAFIAGCGSDPLVADMDGDGLTDGLEVDTYGSSPLSADTDADGLADAEEVVLGTALNNPDSDGDGLLDGWEVANGIDPLSDADDDGADGDPDRDGLANLQEQALGGDPWNGDTDSDGLSDFEESQLGTSLILADTDRDGLLDGLERSFGLNPLQPDSDGDGMNDGWEYQYRASGFDPAVDNATDDNQNNDIGADPDGDGLKNGQECDWGTNPSGADVSNDGIPDGFDTDGDGVGDGAEIGQNSDPADPSDEGIPNSRIPVSFTFGDPSGSQSEKYRLEVTPVSGVGESPSSFSWLNENYGECETKTGMLKPGWKYEVRLYHAGSNGSGDGYPDYDYELVFSANSLPANVIASDPDSLFGLDYTSTSFDGEGKVAYIWVLGLPKLIPDYDRDGKIDSADEAVYGAGQTTFRFWVNDDNDSGDVNDSDNDRPGSGSNGQDGVVNGRGDLLDFTPVLIDISGVLPPGTLDDIRTNISWKLESSAVNAVWTRLPASEAGCFLTNDCGNTFGPDLSQPAHAATVANLSVGVSLPAGFVAAMDNNGGKGVVMVEGRAAGSSLRLKGYLGNATSPTVEGELDIVVSSVEGMYRWLCLRAACGDDSGLEQRLVDPANWPDEERDGRHFVFVHGYNVNVQSARGWASEMFKRLWQAGSNSRFTAVDWYGNESQLWGWIPVLGGEALDYYVNVRNALDTAPGFATAVNALQGGKVLLEHSLGNMLVSEAAKKHSLGYSKYYMLNAAVPVEAYDEVSEAFEMCEHGWTDVNTRSWAAKWHELFSNSQDVRRNLKWKGRFAGIHDAINCYSPTEDVLGNATANGWGGLWSMQELFKGTATLHAIPGNCEGGWGYNGNHTDLLGRLTAFARTNDFTDVELITNPVFRPFDNALLHQTNEITIAETELNKVLGDGIPAISFAAGANPVGNGGVSDNYNFHTAMGASWPSDRIEHGSRLWYHSDIVKLAFYYVSPAFKEILKGGNQ